MALVILGLSQSLRLDGTLHATVAAKAALTEQLLLSMLTGVFTATVLTLLVGGVIGQRYSSWIKNLEESPAGS